MTGPVYLSRARTPAAPGPGPVPDALLRSLDLRVSRRIGGLLAGEFPSMFAGSGIELVQIRAYQPGDDVREIDWNATARTGETQLRVRMAERVLTTWLLLDASPSMTFGTTTRRKADVAEGVALAVAHLTTRRGNRMGLMTFGEPRPKILPPGPGRAGLLRALSALRSDPPPDGSGPTSVTTALRRLGGVAGLQGLVFVVSDMMGPKDWRRQLVALSGRHDVIVVEVRDRREHELPDVGEVWLIDPETGDRVRADTGSRRLRRHFAAAARAERDEVAEMIRSAGADHLVLTTDEDWLREFVRFLVMRPKKR